MKNQNNPVVTPSTNKLMNIVHVMILSLACLTGCASESYGIKPGDIPNNTQLALSANGQRLLVSWNDSNKNLHAQLVELNGSEVASIRELNLPSNTYTTAFAKNNEQLLFTTIEKGKSDLLTFNLSDNLLNLIYKSERIMRFPLEASDGNYVFLEGTDPDSRMNQWQRYQGGQKTLLNPKNYGSATTVNVIGDAVFIIEPWSPPAFRNLYGALPKGLGNLIDSTTFLIKCADKTPLTCIRTHAFYDPAYGTMEFLNGTQRCEIAGRWIDEREVQISRDGSVVVFHAAIKEHGGPRAIYFVKNENLKCSVHRLTLGGN